MNHHTRFFLMIISITFILLFIACDSTNLLGELNPGTVETEEEETCHGHPEYSNGGLKLEFFDCDRNLLWYEIYTKEGGKTVKTQHYLSMGILQYTETFEYNAEGERILYQYWDGEAVVLVNSYVYGYENGKKVITAYYDNANTLKSFTQRIYEGETSLTVINYEGDPDDSNRFVAMSISEEDKDASGNTIYKTSYTRYELNIAEIYPQGVTQTQYDSQSRAVKESYWAPSGIAADIVDSSVMPDQTAAQGDNIPNSAGLSVPIPPAAPVITRPTLTENTTQQIEIWTYDDFGYVYAVMNDDQRPTTIIRKDTRLQHGIEGLTAPLTDGSYIDTVELTLEYYPEDETSVTNYKLWRKNLTWGNLTLGTVEIEYDDEGYLKRIHTDSIFISNFDLGIQYHDNRALNRVNVYIGDVLMEYFVYDAEPDPDALENPEENQAHPLDPTGQTGLIHTITHYENSGDEYLSDDDMILQIFEFDYDYAEALKLDVLLPDDTPEDLTDNASNGYYLITQNAAGQTMTLASYSAAEVQQWTYSYNYADILDESIRLYEEKINQLGAEANTIMSFIGNPLELLF